MKIPNIFLLPILLILIAAGIVFYQLIENSIIFHPDRQLDDNPSNWELFYKDIQFLTPDGQRLHGWFFPLSEKSPVLIFCHGNAGNISHRIENVKFLVSKGISVFLFSYRGYGKSSGRPSEKGIYIDGLAACDYLTKIEKISSDRIAVFGRSLGGSVAIEIALKRKARCLIIESTSHPLRKWRKLFSPFLFFHLFYPIITIIFLKLPMLVFQN